MPRGTQRRGSRKGSSPADAEDEDIDQDPTQVDVPPPSGSRAGDGAGGVAAHTPQPNLPAPQRPSKEPVLNPEDPEIVEYRRAARKFHPERQWNEFWGELKRACGPRGIQRVDSAKLAAWMARSGMKIPR